MNFWRTFVLSVVDFPWLDFLFFGILYFGRVTSLLWFGYDFFIPHVVVFSSFIILTLAPCLGVCHTCVQLSLRPQVFRFGVSLLQLPVRHGFHVPALFCTFSGLVWRTSWNQRLCCWSWICFIVGIRNLAGFPLGPATHFVCRHSRWCHTTWFLLSKLWPWTSKVILY